MVGGKGEGRRRERKPKRNEGVGDMRGGMRREGTGMRGKVGKEMKGIGGWGWVLILVVELWVLGKGGEGGG